MRLYDDVCDVYDKYRCSLVAKIENQTKIEETFKI